MINDSPFDYLIELRDYEFGTAWLLRLFDSGTEVKGRVYPIASFLPESADPQDFAAWQIASAAALEQAVFDGETFLLSVWSDDSVH